MAMPYLDLVGIHAATEVLHSSGYILHFGSNERIPFGVSNSLTIRMLFFCFASNGE